MARFAHLPPAFFDPRVSDVALQEAWAKGAEEAVRRLRITVARLEADLAQAQEDLADAEEFAVDAAHALDHYRAQTHTDAHARVAPVRSARAIVRALPPRANG